MNDIPVVVKLANGETFMGMLVEEKSKNIVISKPISVKTITVNTNAGMVERTVTAPFCTLTDDFEFSIDKIHILYISNLHPSVTDYYWRLVDAYEEDSSGFADSLDATDFDEEDEDLELDFDFEEDSTVVLPEKPTVH